MNAHARTATTSHVAVIVLTVLAVSGWGAFAYVSWSAARTEGALQSQMTHLTADRSGPAAPQKQAGPERAATRMVYPTPYRTSAPTPAQASSALPPAAAPTISAQPSAAVSEPVAAEQRVANEPSSSSVPFPVAEPASPDAQDARSAREAGDPKLVDINTASVEELNRLGGRFGRAIVAGRPYTSIDELVSRRVLTRSTFAEIKDRITAN